MKKLHGCIVGLSGFIGPHHLSAARSIISPRVEIDACVPGTSSNWPEKLALAESMGFETDRIYPDLATMLREEKESSRFVLIATPNKYHAVQSVAAVEAGYHLICDKPLGRDKDEADRICDAVEHAGAKSCVTATYCGHAALIQARSMLRSTPKNPRNLQGGRFLYDQAWLKSKQAEMVAAQGSKQSLWRRDANESGKGGAAGDTLSHLLFQLHFMTGLKITGVRASRRFVVEGQKVNNTDDQVTVQVIMENGALISLEATQYAGGHQNDNSWELWFEGGTAIGWSIRESEFLWYVADGGHRQVLTRDNFTSQSLAATRPMPSLHIDGWHDANARLITSFAWDVLGEIPQGAQLFHPDVHLARNINAVIDAIITSADQGPWRFVAVDWK